MRYKVNEIKISYSENIPKKLSYKVNCSQDIAKFLYDNWDKKTIQLKETFKVVLLNNSNLVKGVCEISSGGITGTIVDLRILFAVVLKSLTVGIILAHNHPSGNLKPSNSDKLLTDKIIQGAKVLDVNVLDHIILGPDGDYLSFADKGFL